jgi:hypothetical protein
VRACIQNVTKDNIKMDLQEVGWGSIDWFELGQDRDTWRTRVCGNEPLGSVRYGEFLDEPVGCSKRTLLHAVSNKEVARCNGVLDNPRFLLPREQSVARTQTEGTTPCCSQQSPTAHCSDAPASSPGIHSHVYGVLFNIIFPPIFRLSVAILAS